LMPLHRIAVVPWYTNFPIICLSGQGGKPLASCPLPSHCGAWRELPLTVQVIACCAGSLAAGDKEPALGRIVLKGGEHLRVHVLLGLIAKDVGAVFVEVLQEVVEPRREVLPGDAMLLFNPNGA
jgi:hypothetical protein